MSKAFWAALAVIVLVFGGIIFFKSGKTNAPAATSTAPTNHVIGAGTTGVKLVEYGDYQCPYCAAYYPLVKSVQQKYGDQITLQFRNLPLLQVHKNAFVAARAAEAAAIQGRFWDMHDLLYANQKTWSESDSAQNFIDQYASSLHLDMTKFHQDEQSDHVNALINADIAAFLKTGQQESTPTFFLDGKKISPTSLDEFSKLIDAEIKAKAKS